MKKTLWGNRSWADRAMIVMGYDKRRRDADINLMLPSFVEQAKRLNHGNAIFLDYAKAGFMSHAMNDKAWTRWYTEEEIIEIIDGLE
mgnify:CR=1 FL=1